MKLLVSACLLGVPCRYDGKAKTHDGVLSLLGRHTLIPFCPEIYGGLPTPRPASERLGERVVAKTGSDVTAVPARCRGSAAAMPAVRLRSRPAEGTQPQLRARRHSQRAVRWRFGGGRWRNGGAAATKRHCRVRRKRVGAAAVILESDKAGLVKGDRLGFLYLFYIPRKR